MGGKKTSWKVSIPLWVLLPNSNMSSSHLKCWTWQQNKSKCIVLQVQTLSYPILGQFRWWWFHRYWRSTKCWHIYVSAVGNHNKNMLQIHLAFDLNSSGRENQQDFFQWPVEHFLLFFLARAPNDWIFEWDMMSLLSGWLKQEGTDLRAPR